MSRRVFHCRNAGCTWLSSDAMPGVASGGGLGSPAERVFLQTADKGADKPVHLKPYATAPTRQVEAPQPATDPWP
jgi:hypothetical protein